MASLGSLGKPRPPREDHFDWFGETVRVNPELTDITLTEFMEAAARIEADKDEMAAATFVKTAMRDFVHPDDFDTYWRVGREQRQTTEDHMRVMQVVVETVAERPTQQSSASPAGPPASEDESTAALLQRATAGRPDLELGLMNELERRRAAQAG